MGLVRWGSQGGAAWGEGQGRVGLHGGMDSMLRLCIYVG